MATLPTKPLPQFALPPTTPPPISDDLLYAYIEREVANGATLVDPAKMTPELAAQIQAAPPDARFIVFDENTLGALRTKLQNQFRTTTMVNRSARPGYNTPAAGVTLADLKPLTYVRVQTEAEAQKESPKHWLENLRNQKKSALQSDVAFTKSALDWLNSGDVAPFIRKEETKAKDYDKAFKYGMAVLSLGAGAAALASGGAAGAGAGTAAGEVGTTEVAKQSLFSSLANALQTIPNAISQIPVVGPALSVVPQIAVDSLQFIGQNIAQAATTKGFMGLVGDGAKAAAKAALTDWLGGKATQEQADALAQTLGTTSGNLAGIRDQLLAGAAGEGGFLSPELTGAVQTRLQGLLAPQDQQAQVAEQYGLLRQLAAPGEERARMSQEERLFAQGLLGSTTGGIQQKALLEAQTQADLADRLAAYGRADTAEARRIQEETGLFGDLAKAEALRITGLSEAGKLAQAGGTYDLAAAEQRAASDAAAARRKQDYINAGINIIGGLFD